MSHTHRLTFVAGGSFLLTAGTGLCKGTGGEGRKIQGENTHWVMLDASSCCGKVATSRRSGEMKRERRAVANVLGACLCLGFGFVPREVLLH